MKYRAICPGCGIKISRLMFFLGPSLPHNCKSCGCRFRSDAVWEWIADFIFAAIVISVLWLAWSHHITWIVAAMLIAVVVAICYVIFPFVTPFVFSGKKKSDEQKPSA
jgi:hypothetical protein